MAIKFEIPSNVDSFNTVDHTVTGTFTLDGYVINPSGAVTNQVLKYNGSSFVAANESGGGGGVTTGSLGIDVVSTNASLTLKPWFSGADYAKAVGFTNGVGAGDYSTGMAFSLSKNATITGIRWYQQVGMTANVKATLWDATTNTSLATITVTPTAGLINTATFSSPYSYTISNNDRLSVTVYDGTNQILYTAMGGNAPLFVAGVMGYALYSYGNGYASGDSGQVNVGAGGYFGIEPVYTIP